MLYSCYMHQKNIVGQRCPMPIFDVALISAIVTSSQRMPVYTFFRKKRCLQRLFTYNPMGKGKTSKKAQRPTSFLVQFPQLFRKVLGDVKRLSDN